MKVAIPVADGIISSHFGHSAEFRFYEADPDSGTTKFIESTPAPAHEPGFLPRWLSERGVNLVLAGGMGNRAEQMLENLGIKVIKGAPAAEPEEILKSCLAGTLKTNPTSCGH